jgi:hypothetical protein
MVAFAHPSADVVGQFAFEEIAHLVAKGDFLGCEGQVHRNILARSEGNARRIEVFGNAGDQA